MQKLIVKLELDLPHELSVEEVASAVDYSFGKKVVLSASDAAQQYMHLTDGTLRDLLVSLTPQQLSALKALFISSIGR